MPFSSPVSTFYLLCLTMSTFLKNHQSASLIDNFLHTYFQCDLHYCCYKVSCKKVYFLSTPSPLAMNTSFHHCCNSLPVLLSHSSLSNGMLLTEDKFLCSLFPLHLGIIYYSTITFFPKKLDIKYYMFLFFPLTPIWDSDDKLEVDANKV